MKKQQGQIVYHLPDSLTGRCWKCGKKRGVKYGGVCYEKEATQKGQTS